MDPLGWIGVEPEVPGVGGILGIELPCGLGIYGIEKELYFGMLLI